MRFSKRKVTHHDVSRQEANSEAAAAQDFSAYKCTIKEPSAPDDNDWNTDNSIKYNLQRDFRNSMQEKSMLKIYYAYELFLYNYSKQTGGVIIL